MKHPFICLSALTALAAFPAHATPRWPNWYLGLGAGVAMTDEQDIQGGGHYDLENGYQFTAALGYRPRTDVAPLNMMRIEAEFGYRSNSIENGTGDYKAKTYMANFLYDIGEPEQSFIPYLGAGVGLVDGEIDGTGADGSDTSFGYQLMGGVAYAPETLPNTEWSIGYRYLSVPSDFQFNGSDVEYSSHAVEVGTRLLF